MRREIKYEIYASLSVGEMLVAPTEYFICKDRIKQLKLPRTRRGFGGFAESFK